MNSMDQLILPADELFGKAKTNTRLKSETEVGVIAEKSPDGRYIRYNEILGRGAFKIVYKGFDEVDGIEVAWNQVSVDDALQSAEHLERLYSEVHLLKSLKHENIIKSYSSWVDDENKTINMITELFTSGSLRQYRKKHKSVDMKAIKNWARQILRGLHYLHSHKPPIIHRDLKCDNIFVNGNNGGVKIGDLGLATIMQKPTARSVIGTPEFMAPELYEEEYNELVDIYAFGMCMLELITCEYPYSECKNQAQIYKKVTTGIKPAVLGRVNDPQLKQFIGKCLVPAALRLSAAELLKDSFFSFETSKELICEPLQLHNFVPKSITRLKSNSHSMEIDSHDNYLSFSTTCTKSITETPQKNSAVENKRCNEKNEFRLRAEKYDDKSISFTLRIADFSGRARNIHFIFYLDSDTALSIAGEMVEQLDLPNEDVTSIAESIDSLIIQIVPSWRSSCGKSCTLESCYGDVVALQHDQGSTWDSRLEILENHGVEELIAAEICAEYSPDNNNARRSDHYSIEHCGYGSERSDDSLGGSIVMSELKNNSEVSLVNSLGEISDGLNFVNISSSHSVEDHYNKLKVELDSIDSQYQHCFRQLMKLRDEAIDNAKKRWVMKKVSAV